MAYESKRTFETRLQTKSPEKAKEEHQSQEDDEVVEDRVLVKNPFRDHDEYISDTSHPSYRPNTIRNPSKPAENLEKPMENRSTP